MWTNDARAATLFDAGAASVLFAAGNGNLLLQTLSLGPIVDLNRHGAKAVTSEIPALPTDKNIIQLAPAFINGVTQRYPFPPLGLVDYPQGIRGDALFGSAIQSMMQLIDNPPWLAQPDSGDLVARVLAQIASSGTDASLVESCRSMVAKEVSAEKPVTTDTSHECAVLLKAYLAQLPPERRQAGAIGILVTQMSYNAAVFHNEQSSAGVLRLLGDAALLDASAPAYAKDRLAAKSIAVTDWVAQFHLGLQLTADLLSG